MKTIEVHILQNFPPSNLNRDDSGAPKDCDFGGYRRQRISSQCLKRSVRDLFMKNSAIATATRTKQFPKILTKKIVELGMSAERSEMLGYGLLGAIHGLDENETRIILNYGEYEIGKIAEYLFKNSETVQVTIEKLGKQKEDKGKKEKLAFAKQFVKDVFPKQYSRPVDVALFGRMLASSPTENIDAACQVSHALSVNRMNMEFDYFTAVDDIKQEENDPGAGMIGTVGFASSCFYRFACVDMDQLARNLGGDGKAAQEGIMAFTEAFIQARPSGKQNTFAAHSLPAFILFVVRENGQPVSLVNAFEEPVKPSATNGQSLTDGAIAALSTHYGKLKKMYGLNGTAMCVMLDDSETAVTHLQKAGVQVQEDVPTLLTALKHTFTA